MRQGALKTRAIVFSAFFLGCTAAIAQNSPSPQEAWAQLREHGKAVTEAYMTYDGTFTQLQEMMRHAGPQFAPDQQKFLEFRNLIALRHRIGVYDLWSSAGGGGVANTLRNARIDFDRLKAMQPRFLQLAAQMESSKTPQSEREFLNYLKIFGGTIRSLDTSQIEPIYRRIGAFADDCALHGNTVGRFGEPTRLALDAYAAKLRPSDRNAQRRFDSEMSAMRASRDRLFQFLTTWDANQNRYLIAANVVKNDWRRIHEDSARLADFLASPTFVQDLPHIDASNAVDTLARIGGYLDTYR